MIFWKLERSLHFLYIGDLELIISWANSNLVEFNESKTQSCLFSNKRSSYAFNLNFNGTSILNSEFIHSVGMRLSDSLIWHDHIVEAAKRASSSRVGFLSRAKHYLDADNLGLVYKTIVRT